MWIYRTKQDGNTDTKNRITYHFLRRILWIFRINWPVAIIKAEGHSLFSRVPSAIKPTVNLTTERKKTERPIYFEADRKIKYLKTNRNFIQDLYCGKGMTNSLFSLFNFLWCSEWGGDVHDRSAEGFLLKGLFITAKVPQAIYNKCNLVTLHNMCISRKAL